MSRTKKYSALKNLSGYWRVDGIGKVTNVAKGEVTVHFSKLYEEHALDKKYKRSDRTGETFDFRVHSSALFDLTVGSVWKDSVKVSSPDEFQETFNVDISRAKEFKLNDLVPLEGNKYGTLLHESYFSLGSNRQKLSNSCYFLVPVVSSPSIEWLIIPSSEVLRFYIGTSDRLLSAALKGTLDTWIDWKRSKASAGEVTIVERRRLKKVEHVVIYRSLNSPYGKESLFGTHNKLKREKLMANVSGETDQMRFISSAFPFSGYSALTIKGKRLPLCFDKKDRTNWAVFAMEIVHCGYKEALKYINIISNETKTSSTGEGLGFPVQSGVFDDLDEDDDELTGGPSDATVRGIHETNFKTRFALQKEFYYRRRPMLERSSPNFSYESYIEPNGYSLEEGNYESASQGILESGISDQASALPEHHLLVFCETIGLILKGKEDAGWKVNFRTLDESIPVKFGKVTTFPKNCGKNYRWQWIAEPHRSKRLRQCVIAEFFNINMRQYLYLLEMELSPTRKTRDSQVTILLRSKKYFKVTDQVLEKYLKLSVKKNRWADESHEWKYDKDTDCAEMMFSQHVTHRFTHPNVMPSMNAYVKQWSISLASKITENCPNWQ